MSKRTKRQHFLSWRKQLHIINSIYLLVFWLPSTRLRCTKRLHGRLPTSRGLKRKKVLKWACTGCTGCIGPETTHVAWMTCTLMGTNITIFRYIVRTDSQKLSEEGDTTFCMCIGLLQETLYCYHCSLFGSILLHHHSIFVYTDSTSFSSYLPMRKISINRPCEVTAEWGVSCGCVRDKCPKPRGSRALSGGRATANDDSFP
jgi:hypothetical protein